MKSAVLKGKPPTYAQLVKLARELAHEVWTELYAAGADEIKENPLLRSKEKLWERAERMLARVEE